MAQRGFQLVRPAASRAVKAAVAGGAGRQAAFAPPRPRGRACASVATETAAQKTDDRSAPEARRGERLPWCQQGAPGINFSDSAFPFSRFPDFFFHKALRLKDNIILE